MTRIADILLWPGTWLCRYFGVDPESDQGLIRAMFNMLVYLVIILSLTWIVLA